MDAQLEEKIRYNPKKVDINGYFSKYQISNFAQKKIQTYADRIAELYGEPIEVLGFNTAPLDKFDMIHYGAVVALDQTVSGGLCDQNSLKSYFKTKEKVKADGQKIVGWWHSHGDNHLSPSPKDKDFFEKLIATSVDSSLLELDPYVNLIGEVPYKYKIEKKDGNKILTIESNEYLLKNIVLVLENFAAGENFRIKDIRLESFKGIPFSQMYIVNALKEEPYREFGIIDINDKVNDISDIDFANKKYNITYKRNLDSEILDIYDNKNIDINKIDEELKNQVYVDGKLLRDIVEKRNSRKFTVLENLQAKEESEEVIDLTKKENREKGRESLEKDIEKVRKETTVDLTKIYSTEERIKGLRSEHYNNSSKELVEKTKSQKKSFGRRFIDFISK